MIEAAAIDNGLPVEFFARLIWRESSFRPDAVGPMTRRGDRAQGIAQFMPATAAERGLLDPLDPVQALPEAAAFLRELRAEFGNLGLAAAAYNAGPQRVRDWLANRAKLPGETRNYVEAVTGRSAESWIGSADTGTQDFKRTDCGTITAWLKKNPSRFVDELETRVGQSVRMPWGVQLSAGFSRAKALHAYASIERRYRAALAGTDPIVTGNRFRSRGTRPFYQVRVGAATRESANRLCARLRAAGAACMVLRNRSG